MKFLRIGVGALIVWGIGGGGSWENWVEGVVWAGAALLFIAWSVRKYFTDREIVLSPLLLPLIALSLLALGQRAFRGTVSPYDTRLDLQLLLTYAILLFLATQLFRTADDWRGFVWFIMFLGFLVAIFGILQHLTFNGKLYWFREMRFGGIPFGPYVNRNHFAGFAELVIPTALVPLVLGKIRRERRFAVVVFALLPVVALFLAASRGGIVSFAAEIGVLTLLLALRRAGGRHVLAGGVVLLLAFMLVSWLGVRQILERFSTMQSLEVTGGERAPPPPDPLRIALHRPRARTRL